MTGYVMECSQFCYDACFFNACWLFHDFSEQGDLFLPQALLFNYAIFYNAASHTNATASL